MNNLGLHDVADMAYESLLFEVELTPKPGLVDLDNTGSHQDMDVSTFRASAESLHKHFYNYLKIGYNHTGDARDLFNKLRLEGIDAEASMFKATSGINTHKGANFTFALFLGAIGYLSRNNKLSVTNLFDYVRLLSQDLMTDFERELMTNGSKVFKDYGIAGVRGEAILGYPTIQKYFVDINFDESNEYFWHKKLLEIMINTEDANLVHRGGKSGLDFAQKEAKRIFNDRSHGLLENIKFLDQEFIKRNLSPGGSADLLAVLYFLVQVFAK